MHLMLCVQEVLALHSRLEARAKALISLEEMQAANRPTVRIWGWCWKCKLIAPWGSSPLVNDCTALKHAALPYAHLTLVLPCHLLNLQLLCCMLCCMLCRMCCASMLCHMCMLCPLKLGWAAGVRVTLLLLAVDACSCVSPCARRSASARCGKLSATALSWATWCLR